MTELGMGQENKIIATVSYIHQRVGFYEPPFSFKLFFDEFSGYQVFGARLPRGYDGELLARGQDKIIRYRLEGREPSVRFTIAHEIAHSFLHRTQNHRCQVSRRFRIYEPPELSTKELEADFFALELLAPMPMLNRLSPGLESISPEQFNNLARELARIFGINTITMKSRLKDLKLFRRWDEAEWL